MPIRIRCECGREANVSDEHVGRRMRCPDCGSVVAVSIPVAPATSSSPPPSIEPPSTNAEPIASNVVDDSDGESPTSDDAGESQSPTRFEELFAQRTPVSEQPLPPIVNSREYIESGFRVVRTLNVVTARCVYGSNIWKDLKMAIRDSFGGRSNTAEKLLLDTEKELIRTLREKGQKRGAHALIEFRMQFGEMGGRGGSMFYGTAQATPVILEAIPESAT